MISHVKLAVSQVEVPSSHVDFAVVISQVTFVGSLVEEGQEVWIPLWLATSDQERYIYV